MIEKMPQDKDFNYESHRFDDPDQYVTYAVDLCRRMVAPAEAGMLVEKALSCPALKLEGLMVIPPFSTEAEASRPHYRKLCVLRDDLQQRFGVALPEMSMGMSHDFEVAIAEGATLVRVGTAIFGQRAKKK